MSAPFIRFFFFYNSRQTLGTFNLTTYQNFYDASVKSIFNAMKFQAIPSTRYDIYIYIYIVK